MTEGGRQYQQGPSFTGPAIQRRIEAGDNQPLGHQGFVSVTAQKQRGADHEEAGSHHAHAALIGEAGEESQGEIAVENETEQHPETEVLEFAGQQRREKLERQRD